VLKRRDATTVTELADRDKTASAANLLAIGNVHATGIINDNFKTMEQYLRTVEGISPADDDPAAGQSKSKHEKS
jgi:hypothetical protein